MLHMKGVLTIVLACLEKFLKLLSSYICLFHIIKTAKLSKDTDWIENCELSFICNKNIFEKKGPQKLFENSFQKKKKAKNFQC